MSYRATAHGKDLGRFSVPMPGMHNVLNSLAAVMVGLELKVDPEGIRESLKGFRGIQRRFEFKGEAGGVRFFDDYGHHPAEIRATIEAAQEALRLTKEKNGRVVVLFQPHRYTRTRDLLREFGASFSDANLLYIMDIYAAGEGPLEGVHASAVLDAVRRNGHQEAFYIRDPEGMIKEIGKKLRPHDLFITIGVRGRG